MAKKQKQSKQDNQEFAAKVMLAPAVSMAHAIQGLYAQTIIDTDGTKGLDMGALMDELIDQNKAIQTGNMRRVEAMLLDQAHALQAIFSSYIQRMTCAKYIDQMEAYGRIALKAQNQCRQTLATLGEIKHPRRATFIKQQNNAVNQQVNNGVPPADGENPKNSDKLANKLLEELPHERLDFGKTPETCGAYQTVEAMGEVHRTEDQGRKTTG